MLTEDLKEMVYYLSDEDRAELRGLLVPRKVALRENRGRELMEVMAAVMGERIPDKSRESKYVWARSMVAYQLSTEGYSTTIVARLLDKDHSTVTHMIGKMKDALQFPHMYWDIMPTWNRFQKDIQNDIHGKTIQDLITI